MTFEQRREYERSTLDEASLLPDPFKQFTQWIEEATQSGLIDEPYAMTLATASSQGSPSARVVLLREITAQGFRFFTNYDSRKGRDLTENAFAACVFYWGPLERQIRIEGPVRRIPEADSNAYFASRPHASKLGALVSQQSEVIASRSAIEDSLADLQQQFPPGADVPRPQWWGGYEVFPDVMEFWQGRRSRLHDRLLYRRSDDGWTIERLSP